METTQTSVSAHGGDSSALDVDASFSTDSLPLESHFHFKGDSSQRMFDDSEELPSTTPSPFSTLPAGVSPQHVTNSSTNVLQSSHTFQQETTVSKVTMMAAMEDTEPIKSSVMLKSDDASEVKTDEVLDSIKQELDWSS
jgi:hypothetical protein